MEISAISGRPYSLETGLSTISSNWLVVGKIYVPIKVDSTLGWTENLNQPTYVTTESYLVCPGIYDSTISLWIAATQSVSIVPSFGIDIILELCESERKPTFINGIPYTNNYQISDISSDYYVNSIQNYPIREDANLFWRNPLDSEEPQFIQGSVAICTPAILGATWSVTSSSSYIIPFFSINSVYEWEYVTPATMIFRPTSVYSSICYSTFDYNFYGLFVGSAVSLYLPLGNSPIDDGKTITIKNCDNASTFTLIPTGSQTIDGASSLSNTSVSYGYNEIVFLNDNWYIVSSH